MADDQGGRDLTKGLAAAVGELMAGDEAGRFIKVERQSSLFPVVDEAAFDELEEVEDGGAARGPGRPKGSRNRSTEEWRELILTHYRSPLVFLAEAYARPVEVLAKELGASREDAFRLQVKAAETLAPYVHRKQPQGLDIEPGETLPVIVLVTPERARDLGVGHAAALEIEDQANQGVNVIVPAQSDGAKSDGDGK